MKGIPSFGGSKREFWTEAEGEWDKDEGRRVAGGQAG